MLADSGNAVDEAGQRQLFAGGAVGDVCHNFFDAQGRLVESDLAQRVVGIAPADLLRIPRRVGFAGGESKHEAIRSAILGGWVNVLVTDIGTAQALLVEPGAVAQIA